MSIRRKDTTAKQCEMSGITDNVPELDICSCPPISPLCLSSIKEQDEEDELLPTPPPLSALLRTHVQSLLPSSAPLSILLLHVSQLENIHITPETEVVRKRRRYHPSASVVEQIVANVRRAVRMEDSMYLDTGKGAAILFPNVDQQGAYIILERVYNNVNLLQAETIVPPLTHETDIVLGIASYPEQGSSVEHLLASAGHVMSRLTLRPAITSHLWDTMPPAESVPSFHDTLASEMSAHESTQLASSVRPFAEVLPPPQEGTPVPFLRLPSTLSKRLKKLVSHAVATQFHCVPVGRDHNRLTVAMADPADTNALHVLQESTGMSIFPVSCDKDALNMLLAESW